MTEKQKILCVMTMNLRFGLADDGENRWEKRKPAVTSLINDQGPDFAGIQEVNEFQARYLESAFPEYGILGERENAPDFWQDNIILYHRSWKCIESERFYLSYTPRIPSRFAGSKWPRQCTIAEFEKNGFHLVFVTTHFDFDPLVQKKSAEVVLAELEIKGKEHPVILTGDFNTTPDSSVHDLFTRSNGSERDNKKAGFKNVFKKPCPSTYHGFRGKEANEKSVHDPGCIDWILYTNQLILKKAIVIRKKYCNRYPSDHYPVLAVFRHS